MSSRPAVQWLLAAVVVAGAAARVAQFTATHSLDIDEAMIALNIGTRSFADLARPLDYGQTAPVLFLWAERLVVALGGGEGGGMNAATLRLLPLLAGVALPLAVWRLANRFVEPRQALVAAALTAVSPILLQYSRVAKPYETDALVAVLLVSWAADTIAAPDHGATWLRLLAAGAVALCASASAVLVLAAIAAGLWWAQSHSGRRLAMAALVWGGVFALHYVMLYRGVAEAPFMQQFWEASFLTPTSLDVVPRAWVALQDVLSLAFVGSRAQPWGVVAFVALAVAGTVSLARPKRPWAAALMAGPILAAVVASALRRYPMAPRLMAFAVPLMACLLAAGIAALAARVPRRGAPWVFGLLVLAWLVPPGRAAVAGLGRRDVA
ncbi:MAG: glycosyltransferase family 39 protein, partial [Gemmatimonadales bacterium]